MGRFKPDNEESNSDVRMDTASMKPSLAKARADTLRPKPTFRGNTFLGVNGVDSRALKPSLARATRVESEATLLSRGGLAFEHSCAEVLRNCGWDVRVTPASGDFGADLIAKSGRRIVAIQCKRYMGTVGVAAVQEVHAAKTFYEATHSVVVSLRGYTKAAIVAAEKVGVMLISYEQLPDLASGLR